MLNVGGVNGLSSQPVAQLRYISVARRNSKFKNITHSTVSAFHMWRDKEPTVDALRNSRLSNCYCAESLHTAQSNLLNQKSTHILLKTLYISHYALYQSLLPVTMDALWIWLKVLGVYRANSTACNWLLNGALGPACHVLILLFGHSVVSDSLRPHGLQHARPPCPSPTPGACSDSCPSSRWCHPTISSSVVPFSSCLQSFPASGSFPMNRLSKSGCQSIGASA